MASESRVIRPYGSVDAIQDALDSARLRFGRENWVEPGERHLCSPEDFAAATIQIDFSRDELRNGLVRACKESGTPIESLVVRVRGRSPYIRLSETLWELPAAEMEQAPAQLILTERVDRPRSLQSIHHGAEIDLEVVLNEELADRTPLRPWRKGSWLGRVRFGLQTQGAHASFVPRPLTQEVRSLYSLAEGALRYVHVEAAAALQPDLDFNDAVSLYVDETVLGRWSATPKSDGSRFLQRTLFVDSVSALIHELHLSHANELSSTTAADLRDTTLGRILESLKFPGGNDAALQCLRDQPQRLIGYVESWASLTDATDAMLKEGDR